MSCITVTHQSLQQQCTITSYIHHRLCLYPHSPSLCLVEQFNMENQAEGLSFNHSSGSRPMPGKGQEESSADQGPLDFQNMGDQQFPNTPNQNCRGGGHHSVPNIILTGMIETVTPAGSHKL